MIDYSKLPDMTKPKTSGSGGGYTPPVEGPVMLRLVGYVEVGEHLSVFKGDEKIKKQVSLVFELHGKNYPANNGQPQRMTVNESLSMHEKANLYKMFMTMRDGDNSVKHFAQLVGRPFIGKVKHTKSAAGKTYAKLIDIRQPLREDPETGEIKTIAVPAQVSENRVFIWDLVNKEMWDSIYLPNYNTFQDKIRSALNYKGSMVQAIAEGQADVVQEIAKVQEEPAKKSFNPNGRFKREPIGVTLQPKADMNFDDDLFEGT